MDYGGCDRRKTKGDLRKKRLNRAYKRGGQFRAQNVSEAGGSEEKESNKIKKNRKY